MPLVDAKCTNCGAMLKVNNKNHTAICRYCGSSFIVENAIRYYKFQETISKQHIPNTDTVHTSVEKIFTQNKQNANKNTSHAEPINKNIQIILESKYNRLLSPQSIMTMIDRALSSDDLFFYAKIQNYCTNLDFKFNFDYSKTPSGYSYRCLESVWRDSTYEGEGNDGCYFYEWLEYKTDELTGPYEILKSAQKKITIYYINLLKEGYVTAEFANTLSGPISLWGVKRKKNGEFDDIKFRLNNKFLVPYFFEGLNRAQEVNKYFGGTPYLFCLGNYSIYLDEYNDYSQNTWGKYNKEINDRIKKWRNDNLCQHCGQEFKGIFHKVCSNPECGEPKDY